MADSNTIDQHKQPTETDNSNLDQSGKSKMINTAVAYKTESPKSNSTSFFIRDLLMKDTNKTTISNDDNVEQKILFGGQEHFQSFTRLKELYENRILFKTPLKLNHYLDYLAQFNSNILANTNNNDNLYGSGSYSNHQLGHNSALSTSEILRDKLEPNENPSKCNGSVQ